MTSGRTGLAILHLRRQLADRAAAQSDRQLLERFTREGDEDAFAALVRAHGPMVFGVCRRVLRQEQDAEDAFQATFLVLARRANALRKREAVGSYLYGVAYHLALKLRGRAARRQDRERHAVVRTSADPLDTMSARELQTLLDEELQRLPERYRAPLLLCCLEGRSRDEAALRLGWTGGMVKGRLERGRELLRRRLERRGVALTAALAGTLLAPHAASAAVPPLLARTTVAAALARMPLSAAAAVSAEVQALVDGFARGIPWSHGKSLLALLLTVSVTAGGIVGLARPPVPAPEASEAGARDEQPPPRTDFAGDPLPPGALARLGTLRLRHAANACSLGFSPDGKTLISGGHDNTVRIWDAATGKLVHVVRGTALTHHGACAVLSPDGKTLFTTTDRTVRAWDTATGAEVSCAAKGTVADVLALSPRGNGLACAGGPGDGPSGSDPGIRLWDLAAGKAIGRIGDPEAYYGSLAFTPDGRTLAALGGGLRADAAARGNPLRFWDVATRKELPSPTAGVTDITAFALSPDGKTVAVCRAGAAETVRLLDAATGEELHRLRERNGLVCLTFSPDSTRLVCRAGGDVLRVYDTAGGELLHAFEGAYARTAAFSPDGKTLAAADGYAVRLWDVRAGKERRFAPGPTRPVSCVVLSPDRRTVAVAEDDALKLWEWSTGRELRRFENKRKTVFTRAAFSPDGTILAAGGFSGLSLWEAATGKSIADLLWPQTESQGVSALAFAPDGKTLAWARTDGTIQFWTADPGAKAPSFRAHDGGVEALAYSPDGRTLISAGKDRTVCLWEAATGKEVRRIEGMGVSHEVLGMALSPDGRTLAWTIGDRGALGVWEFDAGKPARTFLGEPVSVYWLAFSPDGRSLATGELGGTVRLWEVATGRERRRFEGHEQEAGPLSFSRDGKVLASGSRDTTVLIWDVLGLRDTGRCPAELTDREREALWADLAGEDSVRAYCAVGLLAAAPRQTGAFLGERLSPARAPDARQLARLIADLDSDTYAEREQAAQELRRLLALGWAEATLRKTLEGSPSAEVRRRIERLLEEKPDLPTGDLLRSLRAVEVLEHSGTPEVRRLLERLAAGEPGARLTRASRAALGRLNGLAP
jgi:RNA polymerase sigma factor (sigma-70 family)